MNTTNIDKLVSEALAIEQDEAYKAGAIGYMARAMIQATMPHRKIESHEFKRHNGSFKLTMLADSEIGLPYGSIPRLLMSWITTEAVKTQQRELILGRTLSKFMAELDMIPSGGRWGSITRLKEQMKKLFSASITCTYENNQEWGVRNIVPIEKADLWWNPKQPNQATIWESKVLLGDSFFQEIIESPVPIDMRALKALKQSPMAIDIYCWLTYRMSYLRRITSIPWPVLQAQFGSNYKDVRQFKRRFINQLKKVMLVYPSVRAKDDGLNFVLLPSKTHIKQQENLHIETSSIKPPIQLSDEAEETRRQKEYEKYLLSSIIELIDNLSDENDRQNIFKGFDDYLVRCNLKDIRNQIKTKQYTKALRVELYQFVNRNWHHVLQELDSYSKFCKQLSL